MNEKISDERLKCFVQGVDLENITPNDEISMASELLSLRSLNKRLVETTGELFIYGRHASDCPAWDGDEKYCNCGLQKVDEQYTALMKEIGGEA